MKKSLLLVGFVCLLVSAKSIAQTTTEPHQLPKAVTAVTSLNTQATLIAEKQLQLDNATTTSRAAVSAIKTELQNLLTTYQSMLKSECSKDNSYEAQRQLIDELMYTEHRIKALTETQR